MTRAILRLSPVAFSLTVAVSVVAAQTSQKPLTVDAIYAHGSLIGKPPEQLTWSPDGKHLTYLDSGQLMEVDAATGKTHVLVDAAKMAALNESPSSETKLEDRQRYGTPSYVWAPDSAHILFDSNGRLWLYGLRNGAGIQIGFSGILLGDDPKFSPDGSFVSFIRDHGLTVIPLRDAGSPALPLAPAPEESGANGKEILNGEVDWVYEEELDARSNYFWSPDSKRIAYLQMDESEVPRYPITDWIPDHATVDWQRYPQPGDANPNVRVGVVAAHGGKTMWIRIPFHAGDDYVPCFGWVDRKTLWIETLSRDQKRRALFFSDADSGDLRQVLEIADPKFLDDDYDVIVGNGFIVLTNWSDGHKQIYLYSYDQQRPLESDAKLVSQLTKGSFEVGDVLCVDTTRKVVDYDSNEGNPLEQQIWQVSFDGRSRQLSAGSGFHLATFDPDGKAFADTFSALMQPPEMRLCQAPDRSAEPAKCRVFWETHALSSWHLHSPLPLEVKAHDGTLLYATLLLPPGAASPAGTPLIVNPYGGPDDQIVANRWSGNLLFDELLAQHGFAVLHADNRGMGSRGRAFAQAAYRDFGAIQLEDQLTVIDAVLKEYPQLDPKRLGWWGWSWGGTFTLYAMTHSDRFRAGVSVAPVTDWHDYDSIYTERYLGLPIDNPEAYQNFSVVNSAGNLKGRLLLIQGTSDENVHLENTVQFVERLNEAEIPYDLQLYPRESHSLLGPAVQTDLHNRILAQFETYLKPDLPVSSGN